METYQFIFWEAIKALGLAFLGLMAIKAIAASRISGGWQTVARAALYGIALGLAALGARAIGQDAAAELCYWASLKDLGRSEIPKAYGNALRAVQLRPGIIRYWQTLGKAKFVAYQFTSVLLDQPALQSLEGGVLDEDDLLRLALSHFFLQQYQEVIPLTRQLMHQNREYAEPYVLEGMAAVGLKKYPEAEQDFLRALQLYPSQVDAVEGLAHTYFLTGQSAKALAILNATVKYTFPPEARKRFDALKDLYEQ